MKKAIVICLALIALIVWFKWDQIVEGGSNSTPKGPNYFFGNVRTGISKAEFDSLERNLPLHEYGLFISEECYVADTIDKAEWREKVEVANVIIRDSLRSMLLESVRCDIRAMETYVDVGEKGYALNGRDYEKFEQHVAEVLVALEKNGYETLSALNRGELRDKVERGYGGGIAMMRKGTMMAYVACHKEEPFLFDEDKIVFVVTLQLRDISIDRGTAGYSVAGSLYYPYKWVENK